MSEIDLVIDRWRANARAAGIELPDASIEVSRQAGTLNQIVALEALLRRLELDFTLPDALARPLDAEPDDA